MYECKMKYKFVLKIPFQILKNLLFSIKICMILEKILYLCSR